MWYLKSQKKPFALTKKMVQYDGDYNLFFNFFQTVTHFLFVIFKRKYTKIKKACKKLLSYAHLKGFF